MTSECPFINLLHESYAISTSSNKGLIKKGVPNVVSHTVNIECYLAIEVIAFISIIFIVGLVGVYIHINLVYGLIAFLTF